MKKLLKKIYNAVMPVSRREFGLCMSELTTVIDGVLVATNQQSEMISNIINQLSGLQMVKAEKKEEQAEKEENDPAFG